MEPSDPSLTEVDITRPSAARVYDYFLGGAHNFAADRALAEEILRITPNLAETVRANRRFLQRSVRLMIRLGIRQFLDIGSGLPTAGNVHEIAQQAAPETRVAYVDVDPISIVQSREILADNTLTVAIQADMRDSDDILNAPALRTLLDLDQPVALLLTSVLHFIPDNPVDVVRRLAEPLAQGSYLVISHATYENQPPEVLEAQKLSGRTATEITLRSRQEIIDMFAGFTLIEPGVVQLPSWRPEPDESAQERPQLVGAVAGVARKD